MKRFVFVDVDYGFDETHAFGKRSEFNAPNSLYEIHTLATISTSGENKENTTFTSEQGDLSEEELGRLPVVRNATNGKFLAVAAGEDLTLFSLEFGISFIVTLHLGEGAEVLTLCFLPRSDLVAVLTREGSLMLVSVPCQRVVYEQKIRGKPFQEEAFMAVTSTVDACVLSVTADGGECSFISIPGFEMPRSKYQERRGPESFREYLTDSHFYRSDCGIRIADALVFSAPSTYFALPKRSNDPPMLALLDEEGVSCFAPLYDNGNMGFVRMRLCGGSRLLIALSCEGELVVWDASTMVILLQKRFLSLGEKPKDFIVIREGGSTLTGANVVLLVEKDGVTELQIRSIGSAEVLYSVVVSADTLLVEETTKDDGNVLLVEPVGIDKMADATVRIRSITESQPELRLKRLLNRGQFDEAEKFAVLFKLDVQDVHKSRVLHLLSGLDSRATQKQMDDLMKYMSKISDNNWVAESCIACASLCERLDWIIELLNFAQSKKISDLETLELLSSLRYNLASYRMLFGPEEESFDSEVWKDFVGGESWVELFLRFCCEKCATEARLLWSRYRGIFHNWIQTGNDAVQKFIDAVGNTSADGLGEALELAEHEVLPVALSTNPAATAAVVCDWLFSVGAMLESTQPESFPSNALYAAATMKRVISYMIEHAITPLQKTMLAHILFEIRADSESMDDPMGRLNKYVNDLQEMETLKNVYNCSMSYKTYTEQTVESVCHLILERVRSLQLIKGHISKYAKPYMAEHKLDFDNTLYEYILEVAQNSAGVVSSANPWDERCLAIAESVGCLRLRCEAVIGIAKRAHPPWSPQLSRAVDAMLKDPHVDLSMKAKLQRQCDLSALGQVMMRYTVPFGDVEKLLSSPRLLSSAVSFIVRQAVIEADSQRRLEDALKVVELSQKLAPGFITREECFLQFCCYSIGEASVEDTFSELVRCISLLKEKERSGLVGRIVNMVICETNSLPMCKTEKDKKRRLVKINAALCVLERFSAKSADAMEIARKLRAMKKLQERFDMFISYKFLDDEEGKKAALKEFIMDASTRTRLFNEVLEFSSALTLNFTRACETAISCALASGGALPSVTIANIALRSCRDPGDELYELLMQSCCYALWVMEDMADREELEQIIVLVEAVANLTTEMSDIAKLPCSDSFSKPVDVYGSTLRISAFVRLFTQLIAQGLIEDCENTADKEGVKIDEWSSRIYGMHRRSGVYRFQSDGALFDKAGAVRAMARVARSVIPSALLPKQCLDGFEISQSQNWNELFVFLSLCNQPLLELSARVFAAGLPCLHDFVQDQQEEFENCVRSLCERVISQNPADLPLALTALIAHSQPATRKVLQNMRKWVAHRQSSQTMLNMIYICRTVGFWHRDFSVMGQLAKHFAQYAWARTLAKLGASLPQSLDLKTVVNEFVRAQISSKILIEFCEDFGLDKDEALIQYALQMAVKSSPEFNVAMAVSDAFQSLKVTENIFLRCYNTVMMLCPYNYEMIELLVDEMKRRALPDDDKHVELLSRLQTAHSFLVANARSGAPTESEIRWYHERQKYIEKAENRVGEMPTELFPNTFEESSGSFSNSIAQDLVDDDLYEKPSLILPQLPPLSKERFPFHPFVFDCEKDVQNILLPIINAELTIFNVGIWQYFAKEARYLNLSSTSLLSNAVMLVIREHVNNKKDIDECDLVLIKKLLFETSNRRGIIGALVQGFKNVPLCETKLRFLSIAAEVARMWLDTENLAKPLSEDERTMIERYLNSIIPALKSYRAEYLLQKSLLLNQRTLDLLSCPNDLIVHLYSNEINWDDPVEKASRVSLVENLAKLYNVDLDPVQKTLIDRWLPESADNTVNFDPNDTDGEIAVPTGNTANGDVVNKFPYSTLTRLIHMLRLRDKKHAAFGLAAVLQKDGTSYATKVRSLCCLLRLLTGDELKSILKLEVDVVCTNLERLLYGQLIETSGLDIPLKTFFSQDKMVLAKSLLSANVRQTAQLAHLIACMTVDYELVDRAMVDSLVTRLHASGKREMLAELLKFCALYPVLARIQNLASLWARAADWMYADINEDRNKAAVRDATRSFLCFCLSCPVEGGRSFGSLGGKVSSLNVPVAEKLMDVAISATASCEKKKKARREVNEADLRLEWSFKPGA